MARTDKEVRALKRRADAAVASLKARSCEAEERAFRAVVQGSTAVMSRTLVAMQIWAFERSTLFNSYYRQKEAGRAPNGSAYDEQRTAAESAIEPYAYYDLSYAALSVDGDGVAYYGEYSCELRTVTIEDRSSVFDRNPFTFNRKHRIIAGQKPPLGYRSDWNSRGLVALAKLHPELQPGMAAADFASILLERDEQNPESDFVEVHIFGAISSVGIERVRGPKPSRPADVILWEEAVATLRSQGTVVEETT